MAEEPTGEALETIRASLRALATLRERPCLAVVGEIQRSALPSIVRAVRDLDAPEIDLLVNGPGGDIEAAYLVVRTIRRHCPVRAAFVPHLAKSAAVLVCLAADEIVLAELGELGPLDAQGSRGSALAPLATIREATAAVLEIVKKPGTPFDPPAKKRRAIARTVLRSVFSQSDAMTLGLAARALAEADDLAERVLRRYRPEIHAGRGQEIVSRLIHGYRCHGFPVDLEELGDLGVPARAAEAEEIDVLEQLSEAFAHADGGLALVEMIAPEEHVRAADRGNGKDEARPH